VLRQACKWSFLAFKGTFSVALNVSEEAADRLLVFRLQESSFMKDFEGRWQVGTAAVGSSSSSSSGCLLGQTGCWQARQPQLQQ
jgi:hypothetical protein